MRVLVTGSDGYIGVRLVDCLLARGHDVTGLDTGYFRDGWLYGDQVTRITTIDKDIRQVDANDLCGVDAVIHLAELSNDPLGQYDPDVTERINALGSIRLAELCKSCGVTRFVYSSSCSVYGLAGDSCKTELSPVNPQTTYAQCKVRVERAVASLADESFCPTFLRNATVFGQSPRMRFDLVLQNLAGMAWTAQHILLTSDGSPWRPLVHISDVCDAMACVLDAPRAVVHNQIFNIGSDSQNYRVREIAESVAEVFPGCLMSFGEPDGDTRSYRVSFEKISRCLPKFSCRYNAHDGARELRTLFQQISLTHDTFTSAAYSRLRALQALRISGQLDAQLYWMHDREHVLVG